MLFQRCLNVTLQRNSSSWTHAFINNVSCTCCVRCSGPRQYHVQCSDRQHWSLKSCSSIPERYQTDDRRFCPVLWWNCGAAESRRSRSHMYPDQHSSLSASTRCSPTRFSSLSRRCELVRSRWDFPEIRSRRLVRYSNPIIRLTTRSGSPPSPFSVLLFAT